MLRHITAPDPDTPLNLSTNPLKAQTVTEVRTVEKRILPPENPAKKYCTDNVSVNSPLLPHKTETNIFPRRRKRRKGRVRKDPVATLIFRAKVNTRQERRENSLDIVAD